VLKKGHRLKKNADFQSVLAGGRFISTPFFLLKYKKNAEKNTRVGFVVSKKISKKATDRNKIKRRMREIVRVADDMLFIKGYDIALIAKAPIMLLTFNFLKEKLTSALKRLPQ